MADDVAEEFKNEILDVLHLGYEAVMKLDPEYFAALKNYYSTWTIPRKESAISRAAKEFVSTGIRLTQGKINGARVHIRRGLLASATPRETFEAITAAAIHGGVPVIWHGATMLKEEMEDLGIAYDERYDGPKNLSG